MGKCYCFVIDQRKDRFERARERRNRRRICALLMEAKKIVKSLIRYTLVMILLGILAWGIWVALLMATRDICLGTMGSVMTIFTIAGPLAERLLDEKE